MARPIRVEYSGAQYHVIARANERRTIFTTGKDYELFLKTLTEACERFDLVLLAYVIMPNHFHLYVETPQGNLSRAIGWLQTTFTIRYNRQKKRVGHLFQGRYKAQLVESDEYGMELIYYIHLNPIRRRKNGKIQQSGDWDDLERYRWCSHAQYRRSNSDSSPAVNLKYFKFWGSDHSKARRGYTSAIRRLLGQEEIFDPFTHIKESFVLGTEAFMEKTKQRIEKMTGAEEVRHRKRWEALDREKHVRGLLKTETNKQIKVWALIARAGVPGVQVAQEFGYSDGSGVTRTVQRVERRIREDKAFRKLVEKYKSQ